MLDFRFDFGRGGALLLFRRGIRGLPRDGDGDSDLILSLGEKAKSAMFNLPLKLGGARSVSAGTVFSSSSSSSFISSILICSLSDL